MSRIIGVALLFIVLVDNFCVNGVLWNNIYVSKGHIRKCRCTVLSNGKMKCHSPLFPTTEAEKQNLIKCLCSKTNQYTILSFQVCRSWRPGFPISLM